MLHRASCARVKVGPRRPRPTGGQRFKACAFVREELDQWLVDQGARPAKLCADCDPENDARLPVAPGVEHLTRQDQRVLSTVLEIAAFHLDSEDRRYELTVEMLAGLLGKTAGQLSSTLERLAAAGLVERQSPAAGRKQPHGCPLFPTIKALRTLADYAAHDEPDLEHELRQLKDGTD